MVIVWIITCMGWLVTISLLVILGTIPGRVQSVDWFFAALMLVASLCLGLRCQFPNRNAGLMTSWCGSALGAFSIMIASSHALRLPAETAVTDAYSVAMAMLRQQVIQGWVLTAAMMWLGRGYGFIPIIALLGCIIRGFRGDRGEKVAREYPWFLWWVFPFIAMAGTLANLTLLTCFVLQH